MSVGRGGIDRSASVSTLYVQLYVAGHEGPHTDGSISPGLLRRVSSCTELGRVWIVLRTDQVLSGPDRCRCLSVACIMVLRPRLRRVYLVGRKAERGEGAHNPL